MAEMIPEIGVLSEGEWRDLAQRQAAEIERLRAAHQDIIKMYEKMMGEPPDWTNFKGDQLTWVREAWYGAANISRTALAHEQSVRTE